MKKKLIVLIIVTAFTAALNIQAGTYTYGNNNEDLDMSFKIGYYIVNGDSDLWDYNSELYYFTKDDLNSFLGAAGLNFHVSNNITISLEVGASYGHTLTEYADYVDMDGFPIETDIELSIVPIEVSLKISPFGRGNYVGRFSAYEKNSFIPYFGGGVGAYFYSYREWGDYINFDAGEIIYAEFESFDVGVGYFVVAGFEIPMSKSTGFVAEFKQTWAKAPLSDSFQGFDDLDLGGKTIYVGFTMGF
jgi:hypothetical protein